MTDKDAENFWNLIRSHSIISTKNREDIEEVAPDEFDLAMLRDIENNPDCQEFVYTTLPQKIKKEPYIPSDEDVKRILAYSQGTENPDKSGTNSGQKIIFFSYIWHYLKQ